MSNQRLPRFVERTSDPEVSGVDMAIFAIGLAFFAGTAIALGVYFGVVTEFWAQ